MNNTNTHTTSHVNTREVIADEIAMVSGAKMTGSDMRGGGTQYQIRE